MKLVLPISVVGNTSKGCHIYSIRYISQEQDINHKREGRHLQGNGHQGWKLDSSPSCENTSFSHRSVFMREALWNTGCK